MKYLMDIAFIGTAYAGYQIQKNAVTIQGTLCRASKELFGTECKITGCSRTDSGVHANSFMCTLETADGAPSIPADALPFAMNSRLPSDIAVKSCVLKDDSFHPRYDVKYKEYVYLILNRPQRDPFFEGRAYHYPKKLDVALMNKAASYLCGKHDFKAFMASGSDIGDTVRDIKYCEVTDEDGIVKICVAADGFLYNMVRIIVGTLVSVSSGKINVEDMEKIIDSKERKFAGFTAGAEGLYLNKVIY
ncbi:MAG: tRNA pseudouridine(38-40) synthase TruA [Ruminococcaceae bacterium]|nr:tRNA pseudouridine(38-40) synthase TruA [Oscillospiraceae bacterium]